MRITLSPLFKSTRQTAHSVFLSFSYFWYIEADIWAPISEFLLFGPSLGTDHPLKLMNGLRVSLVGPMGCNCSSICLGPVPHGGHCLWSVGSKNKMCHDLWFEDRNRHISHDTGEVGHIAHRSHRLRLGSSKRSSQDITLVGPAAAGHRDHDWWLLGCERYGNASIASVGYARQTSCPLWLFSWWRCIGFHVALAGPMWHAVNRGYIRWSPLSLKRYAGSATILRRPASWEMYVWHQISLRFLAPLISDRIYVRLTELRLREIEKRVRQSNIRERQKK
jgi:hypothetical protein